MKAITQYRTKILDGRRALGRSEKLCCKDWRMDRTARASVLVMDSFKSGFKEKLGRIERNHVCSLKHNGRTFVRSESESARQYTLPSFSSSAIHTWTPVTNNWRSQLSCNTHKIATAALKDCPGPLVQKVQRMHPGVQIRLLHVSGITWLTQPLTLLSSVCSLAGNGGSFLP